MKRTLLLALFIFSNAANAVEPLFETPKDMQPTWIDNILSVFGADGEFDDTKAIDMSYLPTAYYTPEKKFGVGLLMVGLYKTDNASSEEQPSSLVLNSFASMNQSYGVTVENMTFLNQGKQRLLLDLELHNEAAVYYGVGIEQGDQDLNHHEFKEQLYSFKPRWMTEVADNYFIGVGADFIYTTADSLELVATQAPVDANSLLPDNFSSGVVITSIYDSRDYRLNATKGWLFQLDAGLYQNDQFDSFSTYNIELANYIDLGSTPGLIAWQVQGHLTSGDVPWNLLPDLGGSDAMRGYIRGRYRDEQMMMGQVEYRLPIFQRYGMVFWGSVGSVAPKVSELTDTLLTAYGTGFRFKIKDNINLRFDVGVGENDTNFYLNVNEVF
ncbi:BamA/TamA family outer membrane protein [Shewanella sp. SR43-4]|uniref:BamA/TamA family outer membrane protein n=1 Tax=Shewanella vesiculosa TaxID=518738 RepID=A0ABV0FN71_9GAMM|nr:MULTISPECIES: BamA/TamA family outer membrane protein [Shewanella]NCQ46010.1 BamA/TamA family outer membrane protein [Shewanella frigidimarina]MBB1317098.1 BamA/TamA family outer membrane protein [Shewanella sp. SR43-4]MBB1476268.1 BamA/TamA family outer membrane protein [Shewanella sp. SG41-3]NCO70468.1 BamA/TamA family outer membrane protein [Shewanella vesiculosa]NCP36460.1 BamA/TamA family outer membrane protein [Shewanella vesiculosa]|tara:strand:+ start:4471 stop:5619 length:1149 start_codon:yes stop_codon:yes gene_type:complete